MEQGADVLLTVKSNQKTLYGQIGSQFQGKRHIPFTASDHEKHHGRDTLWELSAEEAPQHIKASWPGSGSSVLTLPIGITSWCRRSRRVRWIGWPRKPWLIWLPVGAASGERLDLVKLDSL